MLDVIEDPLLLGSYGHQVQISGDELLETFIEVMCEWGHYRTASGLRFPTLEEAREAAAGWRVDRGWNTSPLP